MQRRCSPTGYFAKMKKKTLMHREKVGGASWSMQRRQSAYCQKEILGEPPKTTTLTSHDDPNFCGRGIFPPFAKFSQLAHNSGQDNSFGGLLLTEW
jgi:hypothetical protein